MRVSLCKFKLLTFFSFVFVFFLFPQKVLAITASGTWSAPDNSLGKTIYQTGSASINFPAKGGGASGTFSGGFKEMLKYGGKIR